ncbi:ABC transporter permease [Vibrio palustris]|uniref:Histidine/lysine/arginine/ornithine transport system permease protein HisM n=1 Tax=Vibrio palustris TaxID=1918946 RepID=A0A1R4B105_9VIBR|nr:ABC transporter permease [Vibrio palustris]SJL82591.1 Histidine transport system permease protein HisM [Vibrio palustris]
MIEILQQYGLSFLWTDGYKFTGVAVTLWLLVISVSIGFCLSVPLSVARVSKYKVLSWPVWLFSYVFRGTPLYVQLLICYSGMYTLGFVRESEFLSWFFRSGYNCALLALVLNTCAYTIEIFAGSIRETDAGEVEAARAYGFSTWALYTKIILPAALRRAIPAYSNEVIMMLHSTSLAFAATVPDILKIARDVNSATYMPFHAYGIAAVIYLVISFVLIGLFKRAEKRWLKHLAPVSQTP